MAQDAGRFHGKWKLATLVLMVFAVSLLHYGTQTDRPLIHDVYRRLYYLPVGLSAVWFGLRGGLAVSLAVSAVYVPHIVMQWGGESREVVNRILEVAVFFLFAGVTGYFADREATYRRRWQKVAERLERSYGQLRQQADQILEIENQLRHADRLSAIGELSAGMTHEIRNPLGSIKGAAEILKDGATPEPVRAEFLDILLRETERLDQVVKDFLEYARDQREETGTTVLGLAELVGETLPLVEAQARKAGVILELDLQAGLWVRGVPHQLKQVVLNLLLNAVQASSRGGVVRLSSLLHEGEGRPGAKVVTLAVEDQGSGIRPDERLKVFEPFYTTKREGTGLGLAISQRIAEAHGGALAVREGADGGARFELELPLFDHTEHAWIEEPNGQDSGR